MEVILDNPNHHSSVASTVASYFEKEDHIDVTFVCAGGRKVKGHKLILSVVSPFLKNIFTECGGNQDMITVLLPDVDGNVLKVFLDFVYEGTVKLSKTELEEFKVIQDMLEIRFPGVILNEGLMQRLPRTRPPPLVKLVNNPSGHHTTSLPHNRSVRERQETEATAINSDNHVSENNAGEPSSSVNDSFPPRRQSEDPDNDPLNIPDFYFLPAKNSPLQQKTRHVIDGGGSTQNTNSKEHGQSGVRKRPSAHMANDTLHSVDVPSTVNSEQTEEKRTGKRNKGASFVSRTEKSASNVTDTGGMQTRQTKTRKM